MKLSPSLIPRAFTAVVFIASAAACSNSFSPSPESPGLPNAAVQRTAAAPSPLDYMYALNYKSDDVAQWALDPSSKPLMKPFAPNTSCRRDAGPTRWP
jgi:hypothetical protein